MTDAAASPDARAPGDAAAAQAELVATLRALIQIPSINPDPEPGAESAAARWIAAALADAGLRPEVVEPVPGRGSVVARLRGAGRVSLDDVAPAAHSWTPVLTTEDAAFSPQPAPPLIDVTGAVPVVHFSGPAAVVLRARAAGARFDRSSSLFPGG